MGRFQLPHGSPTTSKTIRFPDDIIASVEEALVGTGSNFSEFVIAAVRAALEDLKESAEK